MKMWKNLAFKLLKLIIQASYLVIPVSSIVLLEIVILWHTIKMVKVMSRFLFDIFVLSACELITSLKMWNVGVTVFVLCFQFQEIVSLSLLVILSIICV